VKGQEQRDQGDERRGRELGSEKYEEDGWSRKIRELPQTKPIKQQTGK